MKEEVEKKKDTLVYFSRESTTRGILCWLFVISVEIILDTN